MIEDFKPLKYWSVYAPEDVDALPEEVYRSIATNKAGHFPLPTEFVLLAPQPGSLVFDVGRYFYGLGRDSGIDDNGCEWSSCRYIIECYENIGDDGHTEMGLIGYALMSSVMLDAYIKAVLACKHAYEFPYIRPELA